MSLILRRIKKWKVIRVENEFLGKGVTVAGLLTGQDVKRDDTK